jgi:myo-inositol-1(or 4)-monophosphatase
MREIAFKAAREAGRILMQKFGAALVIDHKGEIDLVTEVDRMAERIIVNIIRDTFPRHDILAEEEDYGRSNSRYRWIIDPLDGTTNYTHGFPWFAVSIALEVEGEIVLGLVYNPFHQELFYAEKNNGAFHNDIQLSVSKTASLERSLLATGFSYDHKTSPANNYDHFINFQRACQGCRRAGSASLDLAYVAAGRFDGFWEMKLKPWDIAAGKLIVEEAGGAVSNFSGERLDIYGKEILASNGLIHGSMVEVLKQGRRP